MEIKTFVESSARIPIKTLFSVSHIHAWTQNMGSGFRFYMSAYLGPKRMSDSRIFGFEFP